MADITAFPLVGAPHTARRCRTKDSEEQASLFLRKAYHLVANCPQELGIFAVIVSFGIYERI
jgi:hypothetical protein